MSFGSYLKDVKAQIRETDVETRAQDGRGAERARPGTGTAPGPS